MIMVKDQPRGLFRISYPSWIIRAGNKDFIFTGTMTEFKQFKENFPYLNPGSKVTYRRI